MLDFQVKGVSFDSNQDHQGKSGHKHPIANQQRLIRHALGSHSNICAGPYLLVLPKCPDLVPLDPSLFDRLLTPHRSSQ